MNLHRLHLGVVSPTFSRHFPGISLGSFGVGDVAQDCTNAGLRVNAAGTACMDTPQDQAIAQSFVAIYGPHSSVTQTSPSPSFTPSTDPAVFTSPDYIKQSNQAIYAEQANKGLIPPFTQAQFDQWWSQYMQPGAGFNPDAFNKAIGGQDVVESTPVQIHVTNQPAQPTPTQAVNPTPSVSNPMPQPTISTPTGYSVAVAGGVSLATLDSEVQAALAAGMTVPAIISKLQTDIAVFPDMPASDLANYQAEIAKLQGSSTSGSTGLSSIPVWAWVAIAAGALFLFGMKGK
jgi:hypothetical protein